MIVRYQPIVDARTRAIVKAEALSRRDAPPAELAEPATFIPLAEQTGLIREVTGWLVGRVLADRVTWPMPQPDVALNLSLQNLDEPDFVDRTLAALAAAATEPAALWLEVPEALLDETAGRRLEALAALTQAGVRLSLDGFGSRFDASSHLDIGRVPLAELKIDPSFVAGFDVDPRHRAVVRGIVDLGSSLGLRVVAKGVEDEHLAERLERIGCGYAQGFAFGPPLDSDAFAAQLTAAAPAATGAGHAGAPAAAGARDAGASRTAG